MIYSRIHCIHSRMLYKTLMIYILNKLLFKLVWLKEIIIGDLAEKCGNAEGLGGYVRR